jgi:hypothetical protein
MGEARSIDLTKEDLSAIDIVIGLEAYQMKPQLQETTEQDSTKYDEAQTQGVNMFGQRFSLINEQLNSEDSGDADYIPRTDTDSSTFEPPAKKVKQKSNWFST